MAHSPGVLLAGGAGRRVGGADVAFARSGGRSHYLCALLRAGPAATVPAYLDGGSRSVHGWYAQLAASPVDFADESAFRNVNRVPAGPGGLS